MVQCVVHGLLTGDYNFLNFRLLVNVLDEINDAGADLLVLTVKADLTEVGQKCLRRSIKLKA